MKNKDDFEELDDKYIYKLDNINFKPIFILGVERSGTSILYKILSKTNCFNIVSSYHVIKYKELLHNHINNIEEESKKNLQNLFEKKSQFDRGIDRLKITPNFPEEYRFILAQKADADHINSKSISVFEEMCKKIQFISENNKPILLKNPRDFTHSLTIKSLIPNSKFIFIHRHPIKTLSSQVRAMKSLLKNKSVYMSLVAPKYGQVFDNPILLFYYRLLYSYLTPYRVLSATNKLAKSTKTYLININQLNKKDFVYIKYENLCKQPDLEINKILDFLDLKPEHNISYNSFIKPRKTRQLKTIKLFERWINRKLDEYISYLNYKK